LPKRDPSHTAKGKYTKSGDLDVYVSGEGKNGGGILVCPEVFGIKAGDLAEICDVFAAKGYFVVMPDWHRGVYVTDFSKFKEWINKFPWSSIKADFEKNVQPLFKQAGVKKIGGFGLCYGSWVTVHLAGEGYLNTIMNFHPSHTHVFGMNGENAAKVIGAVKCPVLQCPAGADPADNQPGNSDERSFKATAGDMNVCVQAFKDMPHGWVSRADKKDPKQVEQQNIAWGMALDWAEKYVIDGVSPCCPPGSLPKRSAGAHVPKGQYTKSGDLDVYVSGEGKNGAGIIVNPEVFGIKAGDLAEICDAFADQGYFVVMPDWHRGVYVTDFSKFKEWINKFPWSGIKADFEKNVQPLFQKAGVKKIGAIGFCYGTWVNLHLAGECRVQSVMNLHPSHTHVFGMNGEDGAKVVGAVKCPVLQCPAGADPEANQPGNSDEKTWKGTAGSDHVCVKAFKDMPHGWVSRADRKVAAQVEQQNIAWGMALDWARKTLL